MENDSTPKCAYTSQVMIVNLSNGNNLTFNINKWYKLYQRCDSDSYFQIMSTDSNENAQQVKRVSSTNSKRIKKTANSKPRKSGINSFIFHLKAENIFVLFLIY